MAKPEEGLTIDPDSVDLLKNAGVASLALRENTTALGHLSRCARIKPEDAVVYNFRAVALGRLGRREEALRDFERALSLNGQDVNARHGAALCLIKLANDWLTPEKKNDRLRAALGHLQEALLLRPDDLALKMSAARVQYQLGKPQAALSGYRAVLAQQPDEPQKLEALRGKARVEGDLGLPVNALMTALELPAGDPVLRQSVVNAVKWGNLPGEDVAPPESKKRRLT